MWGPHVGPADPGYPPIGGENYDGGELLLYRPVQEGEGFYVEHGGLVYEHDTGDELGLTLLDQLPDLPVDPGPNLRRYLPPLLEAEDDGGQVHAGPGPHDVQLVQRERVHELLLLGHGPGRNLDFPPPGLEVEARALALRSAQLHDSAGVRVYLDHVPLFYPQLNQLDRVLLVGLQALPLVPGLEGELRLGGNPHVRVQGVRGVFDLDLGHLPLVDPSHLPDPDSNGFPQGLGQELRLGDLRRVDL